MVKLYVEGGGDSADLKAACREGFTTFITRAGIANRPRVVACGSRGNAFESFRTAVRLGQPAMLLVDSEEQVAADHARGDADGWQPWRHLTQRNGDHWEKPDGGNEQDCHLMVQCMESWFIADRETLARFFGAGFDVRKLPRSPKIEAVPKQVIYNSLHLATRGCDGKGEYHKGRHSFKLLACIDPGKVTSASDWAGRFVNILKARMEG